MSWLFARMEYGYFCALSVARICVYFFFLMSRRPPRSPLSSSSAASDVYKRQVLQAAMPASTILVILGMEYDGDVLYCAEGVFITHLLGLLTLPFVYYLMSVI